MLSADEMDASDGESDELSPSGVEDEGKDEGKDDHKNEGKNYGEDREADAQEHRAKWQKLEWEIGNQVSKIHVVRLQIFWHAHCAGRSGLDDQVCFDCIYCGLSTTQIELLHIR